MVLHLLGKKSWNVYNADNIFRVRRDEAAAAAREEAEEQAMQEEDAQRRIQLLRGEPVAELLPINSRRSPTPKPKLEEKLGLDVTYGDRDRKRKRMRGEDDTDRDMRHAKRMVEDQDGAKERQIVKAGKIDDDEELVDHAGNINLFPVKGPSGHHRSRDSSNRDESTKSRRERELNQPPVMRLADAAGRSRQGDAKPWYSAAGTSGIAENEENLEMVGKDVWGNDDPRRKSRDQARMAAGDPLAFMKKGVQQVRKVEADRKRWKEERDAEMAAMREDERRRRRRHRERRECEGREGLNESGLEDLKLDDASGSHEQERLRRHHGKDRRYRRGESSRERSEHRHRRRRDDSR